MNINKSISELKQVINITVLQILIGNKGLDTYIKPDTVKSLMSHKNLALWSGHVLKFQFYKVSWSN